MQAPAAVAVKRAEVVRHRAPVIRAVADGEEDELGTLLRAHPLVEGQQGHWEGLPEDLAAARDDDEVEGALDALREGAEDIRREDRPDAVRRERRARGDAADVQGALPDEAGVGHDPDLDVAQGRGALGVDELYAPDEPLAVLLHREVYHGRVSYVCFDVHMVGCKFLSLYVIYTQKVNGHSVRCSKK